MSKRTWIAIGILLVAVVAGGLFLGRLEQRVVEIEKKLQTTPRAIGDGDPIDVQGLHDLQGQTDEYNEGALTGVAISTCALLRNLPSGEKAAVVKVIRDLTSAHPHGSVDFNQGLEDAADVLLACAGEHPLDEPDNG